MRKNHSSGSSFEKAIGYSRCIEIDDWLIISGTTGYDYHTMTIANDIETQLRQTLINIGEAISKTSFTKADIIKVTYILPETEEFEKCHEQLREYFGNVMPAATMFSAQLADKKMKIEIEVWAKKQL